MDFSQNLTLPSVTSTPSQWYFLSLVNVRMFGIYYANKEIQYNYVYDELTAGKGTDEVNSMLHHFIKKIVLPNGHRQLTIYADNCGGQNKNNYVLKMLLAVAQMGDLERVELKFFENGHTKNAVDRGFVHVRKKFAKEDVWTTAQLLEVVNSASVSLALVHIPHDNGIMKVFRSVVKEAYKDLKSLQSYQIFTMEESKPGVVSCRATPSDTVVVQDLRRTYDDICTDAAKLHELFQLHLDKLVPPTPNFEKKLQMYRKVRPYVPKEYLNDPIYDAPNDEEEKIAKTAGQERRKAAAKKKKAASDAKRAESMGEPDVEEAQTSEGGLSTSAAEAKGDTQLRKRARKAQ
ncbi:hypothetical protein PR003_g15552 [Phytophthora rubi]|uniref:DUF7869 domain-containing protein n=1 Tax=Phytophthora rubi TaxID=129364 RepID=A0A6A4EYD1_9STRA|nr:hypothetical protein PR003_g15552 [Phytophthora rubi]